MLLPKELKKKPTLKFNPGLALAGDTGEDQVTWSFKILHDINQCEKEKKIISMKNIKCSIHSGKIKFTLLLLFNSECQLIQLLKIAINTIL